ncbi:HPr(Ser) kinase/phosphatase [Tichowtungia aerotolerans]|uniref:HPr kinase/phosphorylase n=1 Tax=Tichowtungia aerotolerans TaxID=2697043 RepID=A0A6P1MGP4_9BACT|nr:HPr(Ser) kinase/phosphatase [Tichowtungia aerotolerans]QHI70255.1 HPr(Ser) kinase/phosphatase [Tichowtungia aerotolerans]
MSITLKDFWEQGRGRLSLELVTGENALKRPVEEKAINRPGLALTGFFQYFAQRRLQVFGLAEFTYLKSLDSDERVSRLRGIFEKNIPGIVIARNRNPLPEFLTLAEEYSVPLFRTTMITSHFINESTLLIEELTAPRGRVQGTMLEIMGVGVLLQGKAGIGKSETALSLIERGYCLVADDVTEVVRDSRERVVGYANELTRYHMEIRGVGIVHVPSLFGVAAIRRESELDLVIELHPYQHDREEERTGIKPSEIEILDAKFPYYSLPVSPGRDMANIVEATALNHKLKTLGHDAAKELDEKVIGSFLRRAGA